MDEILASIIGWYLLIKGVAMFNNSSEMNASFKSIESSKGQSLLLAIFKIFLGLYVVHIHNVWEMSWEVLITILGWYSLLSGAFRCIAPSALWSRWFGKKITHEGPFAYLSVVYALAGAYILVQIYY